MNISGVKPLVQCPIVKKFLPKKHVEIPTEISDNMYKKLAEHQRAFDYLANRYKIDYSFANINDNSAYVYCINKNPRTGNNAWSKTEIKQNDSFEDSARAIYKLTDEVLEISEC